MKTCLYLIICLFSMTLFAAQNATGTVSSGPSTGQAVAGQVPPAAAEEDTMEEDVNLQDIKLPGKDSPEYWVIRSDAISELTPLLTKKRSEMKMKRQMLADYLVKIGKAEEMASQNIVVPDDPALYAKALGVGEALEDRDVTLPTKTPTWDELAEFAMRFIIYEGYVPVEFDGVEDKNSFVELVKNKETYAQKVRKEMRSYVEDCLKIWIYLGTINQQAACKEWAVQMKLDAEKGIAAEKAMMSEERRLAAADRRAAEEERKFEDSQDRASFRSTRRERVYDSRQDQRQYQQTLLNERYTNAYRW